MSNFMVGLCLVLLVIGTLFFVLFRLLLKRIAATKDKLRKTLSEEGAEAEILNANCFGLASLGVGQMRGNGSWAMSESRILFYFWVGGRQVEIPIAKITAVNIEKAFLGKTVGRSLLAVDFENAQGKADRCCWLLPEPEELRKKIQSMIKE